MTSPEPASPNILEIAGCVPENAQTRTYLFYPWFQRFCSADKDLAF